MLTMRKFINAVHGYREKARETWEQTRLIAWYSAYDRKPFDLTKIIIPGDENIRSTKASQTNKEDAYKLLEKWNK